MKTLSRLFSVCLLCVCASCASESAEAVEYLMGTRIEIRLARSPERDAERDLRELIQDIRNFERIVSAQGEGSFPARLALDGAAYFKDEEEKSYLLPMLQAAFAMARASGGSFDPLIGSLTRLWGFSSLNMRDTPPGEEELARALAKSGYTNLLWLDERGMAVKNEAELDLGAIAKGEILDHAAARLLSWGYRQALLNFGGDVRVLGARIGAPLASCAPRTGHKQAEDGAWRIALRHPRDAQEHWKVLRIHDGAVVTSGDYERFFMYQGKRYQHILNPRDGLPAGGVASASVVGPRAALADALSTALFVMGVEPGLGLLTHFPEYHALFICLSNDILVEHASPGFATRTSHPAR